MVLKAYKSMKEGKLMKSIITSRMFSIFFHICVAVIATFALFIGNL